MTSKLYFAPLTNVYKIYSANHPMKYNGFARGDAYFIDSGTGNLIPPEYHFKKVIKDTDNSLLMRNSDGTILKFYPIDGTTKAGRLAAIITRCGNRMTFVDHNNSGLISTVYDSLSRPITFYYNDKWMLDRIVDFTGREVKYTYRKGIAGLLFCLCHQTIAGFLWFTTPGRFACEAFGFCAAGLAGLTP